MRWVYIASALMVLGFGLVLITLTGETMWASKARSGYPAMIYMALLFILYPLVALVFSANRKRQR